MTLSNNQYAACLIIGLVFMMIGYARTIKTRRDKWGWFVLAGVFIIYPLAVALGRTWIWGWY